MAEVPSVLFNLERYAELGVAGISIGSNDLTQLVLGADRDSELRGRDLRRARPRRAATTCGELIPRARRWACRRRSAARRRRSTPSTPSCSCAPASTRSRSTWTPSTGPGGWSRRPSSDCCSSRLVTPPRGNRTHDQPEKAHGSASAPTIQHRPGRQIVSGTISIAPHGHSATQMPQPLQKSRSIA